MLNFQLHEESHFLNRTTRYSFFDLSSTAALTVVKIGRAEKSLGTVPGLCVWIFTLVRQSPILQAVVPRRKLETFHPPQRMLLSNAEKTRRPTPHMHKTRQ